MKVMNSRMHFEWSGLAIFVAFALVAGAFLIMSRQHLAGVVAIALVPIFIGYLSRSVAIRCVFWGVAILMVVAVLNQMPRSAWDDTFGKVKGEAKPISVERERTPKDPRSSSFSNAVRALREPLKKQ